MRRFDRLDFAVHLDMYMVGRRNKDGDGVHLPTCEADLAPFRRQFVDMFHRLRREHGVDFYLAHNMTIQPGNVGQIAGVVRDVYDLGYRMMSFQPAALQGDPRRWKADYSRVAQNDGEDVWREVERGAGTTLPYKIFHMGDTRCNRTCMCAIVGDRIVPLFRDDCDADARLRDAVIVKHFGNVVLRPLDLKLKLVRFAVMRFWLLPQIALWAVRFAQRAGGFGNVLRRGVKLITFVMHRFMDAENVQQAWEMMEIGVTADDERAGDAGEQVKETIERLSACSYGMAQVGEGRIVPACVQHSVYDAAENIELMKELPLKAPARPAAGAVNP
jgi:hypothetical protein